MPSGTWTLVFLLIACGTSTRDAAPQRNEPGGDAEGADAAPRVGACAVVTAAEAAAIAARAAESVDSLSGSECIYRFGGDARLQVGFTPDAGSAGYSMMRRGADQAAAAGNGQVESVSGLGDEAFFHAQAGELVQTLIVRRGEGVLVVGAVGLGAGLRPKLEAAAHQALPRLETGPQ
jgi:hypothetical protein